MKVAPPVSSLPWLLAASLGLLPGCSDDEEDLQHGSVRITLTRAEGQADNPFVGTAQVRVVLEYGPCLENFYEANPEYQQEGAQGDLVFGRLEDGGEGWADRLCDDPEPQQIECEVALIEQELDQSSQLRVTYNVQADDLETRFLRVGPIPLPELAMCEAGQEPRVRLTPNPVTGFDANGMTIWNTATFNAPEANPNQGADLVVNIARN